MDWVQVLGVVLVPAVLGVPIRGLGFCCLCTLGGVPVFPGGFATLPSRPGSSRGGVSFGLDASGAGERWCSLLAVPPGPLSGMVP